MTRFRQVIAALLVCTPLLSSPAQAGGVSHVGIASIDKEAAFELSLGYTVTGKGFYLGPSIGFDVSRGDDADSRYYNQTQKNGTEVCRDSSNGQYAKSEKCSGTAKFRAFAQLEAGYRMGTFGTLGAGVRVSDETLPYAVVNFGGPGRANFRIAAGKEYASLGASFGF